jgi:hypothetical protein
MTMRRMNRSFIVLAACLLPALPAGAQMYKWTDADGKVHYSDQPPPDSAKQSSTLAKPRPAAPAAAPATPAEGKPDAASKPDTASKPRSVAEQEMEFRKRRLEKAEADAKRQKEAEQAKEKQRNCEVAKQRVAQLQAGGRITKSAPNGEHVFMEDAEIARELVDARKTADSWCKG